MKLKTLLLAGFVAAFAMQAYADDVYYAKFVRYDDPTTGEPIDNTVEANQILFEGMAPNETKTVSVLVFHDPEFKFRETQLEFRLIGDGIKFTKNLQKGKRMLETSWYDEDADETQPYNLTTAWQPKGADNQEERDKHKWTMGIGYMIAPVDLAGESGQELCRLIIQTDETWTESSTAELKYEILLSPRDGSPATYVGHMDDPGLPIKGYATAVSDVNVGKTVSSVKYYNVAGVESAEPFQGVNIVVTTYADGSKTTNKVVK